MKKEQFEQLLNAFEDLKELVRLNWDFAPKGTQEQLLLARLRQSLNPTWQILKRIERDVEED